MRRACRLQGRPVPPIFASRLRRLPKIGSPTPRPCRSLARSLTPPSPPGWWLRLSQTQGDETMTFSLEQHIEELRAELANCADWGERLQIEAALAGARQELVFATQSSTPCFRKNRLPERCPSTHLQIKSQIETAVAATPLALSNVSSVDPISSTSGMVQPGRHAATFGHQNFPQPSASSRNKIQLPPGPPLSLRPSRCGAPFPVCSSSPR